MKKFSLTGENLAHFLSIQESIRTTKRRVSLGGAPEFAEREFYEDILPSAWSNRRAGESLTLSRTTSERSFNDREHHRKPNVHKTADFNSGIWKKTTEEKSDWMLDDLKHTKDDVKNKLSRATENSQCKEISVDAGSMKRRNNHKNQYRGEINMRLYDQMSQEEEQNIYDEICYKHGKESGKRYLLVRAMIKPEEKIQAWTTQASKRQTYTQKNVKCQEAKTEHERSRLCPEISEDVTQKMLTLVEMVPFCSTEIIQKRKNWKEVLKKSPKRRDHKVMHVSLKGNSVSDFLSEEKFDHSTCSCGMLRCDCDWVKNECKFPKIDKKCGKVDDVNNYLITCRDNLRDKKHQDRRVTVSQNTNYAANRDTKESLYLQSTHNEMESQMLTCLMKVMPPMGQEVSDIGYTHVQELTNVISERKMIDEDEWRVWRHAQAKMDLENSDELDSLDSDIVSSGTTEELSECNIKLSKGLQPSRIPFFKETFNFAEVLFKKIEAKVDKIVSKNHDKRKLLSQKPYTNMLNEKFKLLKNENKLFNQICKLTHDGDYYSKQLVPFSERRRRKVVAAYLMKEKLRKKQNQRKYIDGLQLGKTYRKPKRSFLFTEKENYRGFSPRRRKFLQKPEIDKFKTCNLVSRDLSGRRLTKKVIRDDFRLIRRLFDQKRNKDSLWDPGMKARMEEYLEVLREKRPLGEENEHEDVLFESNPRHPKKDEQKTQTAGPSSWSNCSTDAAQTLASMVQSLRNNAQSGSEYTSRFVSSQRSLGGTRSSLGKLSWSPGEYPVVSSKTQGSFSSGISDSSRTRAPFMKISTQTLPQISNTNTKTKNILLKSAWKSSKTVR